MPRLELIFLHSVNAGGCFRWRDEDNTRIGPPMRPDQPREMGALATQAAVRSALEMIIAGMMGALVKSKADKANVLDDHVLVP